MALDLRQKQLALVHKMLSLEREAAAEARPAWTDPWKVLVYDAHCRDIISTLLNVGELRKRGVTLHLLIDAAREAIPDVPAVYLVQPTESNVRRIAEDCAAGLYDAFHLNFTPAIPRTLLEMLAVQTLESETVASVASVTDRYLNFSSLENDFFSLQLPGRCVQSSGCVVSVMVDVWSLCTAFTRSRRWVLSVSVA
eukprot:6212301-Pleurochrysis_carterae.AAC.3